MTPVHSCPKCKAEIEGIDEVIRCPSCHTNFANPLHGKAAPETKAELPIELIHWDARFLMNNAVIDEQHEKLCELINDLNRAVHSHTYRANFISDTVKSLVEYTVKHFRSEEELFKGTAYPDIDLHLKEHHLFETKAMAFRKEYSESQMDLKPVLRFLVEWFVRHVQQVDRGYKQYINK